MALRRYDDDYNALTITYQEVAALCQAASLGDMEALQYVQYVNACARGEILPSAEVLYRARVMAAALQGHPGAQAVQRGLPKTQLPLPSSLCLSVPSTVATFPAPVSTSPAKKASNSCETGNMKQVKPASQLPRGVHLTSEKRVGDEERSECLEKLGKMFSSGHITQEEYDARADAALKASVKTDLDLLVKDLPEEKVPLPDETKAVASTPWQREVSMSLPAILAGSCVVTAITSTGILAVVFFACLAFMWAFLAVRIAWKK